jgi:hypothetical protein
VPATSTKTITVARSDLRMISALATEVLLPLLSYRNTAGVPVPCGGIADCPSSSQGMNPEMPL